MSDCEKFKIIIEAVANNECSEDDRALLDAHVAECKDCKDELDFVMSINKTLQTLPKMEVPDDFLVSLNKRLDVEDKIKAYASKKSKRNVFRAWQKYSVLTACLLLAVLIHVNVWDLSKNNETTDVVVTPTQTAKVSKSFKNTDKPEDKTEAKTQTTTDIEQSSEIFIDTDNTKNANSEKKATGNGNSVLTKQTLSGASTFETSKNQNAAPKKTENVQIKTESAKVNSPALNTTAPVASNNQVNTASAAVETTSTATEKPQVGITAANAETADAKNPQSYYTENNKKEPSAETKSDIPEYMDNKDNIVIIPETSKRVKFDEHEIVVTKEFLDTFAMVEMPQNNVIVATPTAMASIENMSIDTDSTCPVPETNHGAGSGSLLVSANDVQKVQSILNKYSTGVQNQTFMLTSSNYSSFINELEGEGIKYQDYMIHSGGSNIAFTLISS